MGVYRGLSCVVFLLWCQKVEVGGARGSHGGSVCLPPIVSRSFCTFRIQSRLACWCPAVFVPLWEPYWSAVLR